VLITHTKEKGRPSRNGPSIVATKQRSLTT
jgi:hypothetical protein